MSHLSPKILIPVSLCCLLLAVIATLSWAGLTTRRSVQQLLAGELEAAAASSRQALPIVKGFSTVTLHQVPDIELWRLSLTLLSEAQATKTALTQNLLGNETTTTAPSLKSVSSQIITIGKLYQKTWLIQRLSTKHSARIDEATEVLTTLRENLFMGDHSLIVLFQNSQELRATGGFAGSYALIQLSEGRLIKLEIFDIYQPDGQFTGFVAAPAGVAEYLSSGNGLRLPDANWWPDFPVSAQKVLAFFALGKTDTIDGVIALNLDLVKELLIITGPLYLPDYQTTITTENVAEVLRSNRDEFFPGSVAKQQLLSRFFTQLKLKMGELDVTQQKQTAALFYASLATKQIQMYSSIPELEQLIMSQQAAGVQQSQLPNQPSPPALYLFPVESNVGINKANQAITRTFALDISPTQSRLAIAFRNENAQPTAYVNYQRLFILPTMSVKSITFQGQPITYWDEETVTTANGDKFTQIGFLVTLPAQQTALLNLEITHPAFGIKPTLTFQKQAGVPPTPLKISYGGEITEFNLTTDTWLNLPFNP